MIRVNDKRQPARIRVVLLTGDGRGKTTSALGLVLRAAGHGLRVCVIQFMKSRRDTGETVALGRFPEVELLTCGLGFVPGPSSPAYAEHRTAAAAGLRLARERLADPRVGMVVLDEICGAVARGLLSDADVLAALGEAHDEAIVVLTGRDATPALMERADTVSRIECVKHGHRTGWPAQRGVEL